MKTIENLRFLSKYMMYVIFIQTSIATKHWVPPMISAAAECCKYNTSATWPDGSIAEVPRIPHSSVATKRGVPPMISAAAECCKYYTSATCPDRELEAAVARGPGVHAQEGGPRGHPRGTEADRGDSSRLRRDSGSVAPDDQNLDPEAPAPQGHLHRRRRRLLRRRGEGRRLGRVSHL